MEKRERLALLDRLDELFKVCEGCKFSKGGNAHKKHCNGCSTYKEINGIGSKMSKKKAGSKVEEEKVVAVSPVKEDWLSVEKYIDLNEKLKDKEIAEKLGVNYKKLINWKQKHKDELKGRIIDRRGRQTVSAEVEKTMSFEEAGKQAWEELKNCAQKIDLSNVIDSSMLVAQAIPETDWKTQFEMLSAEYEEVVAKAGDAEKVYKEQIFGLEEKLKELEGIHAACADVEDELHQLRIENINLNDKAYDYRMSYETLKAATAQKDEEYQILRKLVKLWS